MTSPWAEYLNSAKVHPHIFYRDRVHANEFGEQILSKILIAFFDPPRPPGIRDRKVWSWICHSNPIVLLARLPLEDDGAVDPGDNSPTGFLVGVSSHPPDGLLACRTQFA